MDSELVTQYESAKYIVEINKQPCRIFVNQVINSEIAKLLDKHQKTAAYFITPENPFSQPLSDEENALRHQRFIKILNERNYIYYFGYGTDEAETWPKEKSYLIMCDNLDSMQKLASQFGQNGLLKLESKNKVRLQILSPLFYEDV